MKPGTVFQLVGSENHPRIILSNPSRGYVLVCNLSDRRKWPESPCLIDLGEHEWVTKDSAVPFHYLTTLPFDKFPVALRDNRIRISAVPFPEIRVTQIIAAILASDAVSERFKAFLK